MSIDGTDSLTRMGKVDFGGIAREACLAYVPEAKVGDYVVVHVGFALSVVEEAEARKVFEYLREMEELAELESTTSGSDTASPQRVATPDSDSEAEASSHRRTDGANRPANP